MKQYAIWTAQFLLLLIAALAVCLIVTAAIGGTPVAEVFRILANVYL